MTRNPLVGSWQLVSWENRAVDGTITYPLGRDAIGYIMYTEDGYMSVVIMRPQRPHFAADDLFGGSNQERAAAAESFVSYCGRYEFLGDRVLHHVELSLFPNWVGRTQERFVALQGKQLSLSTDTMLIGGRQQRAYLIWQRV